MGLVAYSEASPHTQSAMSSTACAGAGAAVGVSFGKNNVGALLRSLSSSYFGERYSLG